jgi:hypothetical protein
MPSRLLSLTVERLRERAVHFGPDGLEIARRLLEEPARLITVPATRLAECWRPGQSRESLRLSVCPPVTPAWSLSCQPRIGRTGGQDVVLITFWSWWRKYAACEATGLSLQKIADVLNTEGVPTLRGGTEWRVSAVQHALGYQRPRKPHKAPDLPEIRRRKASGLSTCCGISIAALTK